MRQFVVATAALYILGGAGLALADCDAAAGTYLTTKLTGQSPDTKQIGRSLITLNSDGSAIMADSAQGGIEGYQPFTNAMGDWDCVANQITLLLVDMTFDAPDKQRVVRVDTKARLEEGALNGNTTVSFFPLFGDPINDKPEDTLTYRFVSQRIAIQ